MDETMLLGRGRSLVTIPRQMIEKHLEHVPEHSRKRLAFMTNDHHAVRNFVVRELPRTGLPIDPETISHDLNLPPDMVSRILEDLEKNLFFVVRNESGAVSWAFPVTSDVTPHRLTFPSGDRLYGA